MCVPPISGKAYRSFGKRMSFRARLTDSPSRKSQSWQRKSLFLVLHTNRRIKLPEKHRWEKRCFFHVKEENMTKINSWTRIVALFLAALALIGLLPMAAGASIFSQCYFQCFFPFSYYLTSIFFTVIIGCFIACLTGLFYSLYKFVLCFFVLCF